MWEFFIVKFTMLIAFSLGALLVVLYPILKKHSASFAIFSLVVGLVVILLTLYFVFGSPVMREQIFLHALQ
jgi:hypothetical protein